MFKNRRATQPRAPEAPILYLYADELLQSNLMSCDSLWLRIGQLVTIRAARRPPGHFLLGSLTIPEDIYALELH